MPQVAANHTGPGDWLSHLRKQDDPQFFEQASKKWLEELVPKKQKILVNSTI
jgi:hypothetical protein